MRALFVMSSLLLITGLLVPVGSASWTASLSVNGTVTTAAIFCPIDVDLRIQPRTLNIKNGNDSPSVTVRFLTACRKRTTSAMLPR